MNKFNKNFKKNAYKFNKNGFLVIEENNYNNLNNLREKIEIEFSKNNYPREINIDNFSNKKLIDEIIELIPISKLKNIFKEISEINNCGPIYLFPFANIMRNYFSGPFLGQHGWHSDSDGEYKHEFCRKQLNSKKYIFGKIQISFQPNNNFGGNIDVLTKQYCKERKDIPLKIKFFLKIQDFLTKNKFLRRCSLGNRWIIDYINYLYLYTKINPKPISTIIFEHRLFHRGTPIKPKILFDLEKKYEKRLIDNYRLVPKINLEEKNKYVFYIHFGSKTGLLSYLYDRTKRSENSEIEIWEKQFKDLKLFSKEFPNSKIIFNESLKTIFN